MAGFLIFSIDTKHSIQIKKDRQLPYSFLIRKILKTQKTMTIHNEFNIDLYKFECFLKRFVSSAVQNSLKPLLKIA